VKTSQFDFSVPTSLIATKPTDIRTQSRLLVSQNKNSGFKIHSTHFENILQNIQNAESSLFSNHSKNILFIGNSSAVFHARFLTQRTTGGRVEIFLTEYPRQVGENLIGNCMFQPQRRLVVGEKLYVSKEDVLGSKEDVFNPSFEVSSLNPPAVKCPNNFYEVQKKYGKVPVPPYILAQRNNALKFDEIDSHRYHTVYEDKIGSVAAPTAGLHFSEEFMFKAREERCDFQFLNLHIGLGTFAPVKTEDILLHDMHSENYSISENLLQKLKLAYEEKARIILIGTTTLRALESFCQKISANKNMNQWGNSEWNKAFELANTPISTNIFIHPKSEESVYTPKVGHGLLTNFHQPKSTLCMLVASLVGYYNWKFMYEYAVQEKFRLFSYGDANLVLFSEN
jgi:S-adenosylmethionine:tRNA ribosyltransferase-isomerase